MFSSSRTRATESPTRLRLEIGDRQRQQMPEQPGSQFDVDPIGRVGKQIGAQDPQDRLEQGDRDQADHQHVERAHAAMHEHLVDHDLEEQRRDQRKELEEERGDQHFAQQAAVLMDRAQKPGDVEPTRRDR